MRITTITAIIILGLIFMPHALAFGEFNSLEWEIGGLKNEVQSLNNTLRMQRSRDTFRGLSNARSAVLNKLWGMGYQAFYPTNEGSMRAGSANTAQCPTNAHELIGYCVCDQGYVYTGIMNKCQKSTTPSLEEIQKQCPDFPVPDEYPYLKQACKGISPDAVSTPAPKPKTTATLPKRQTKPCNRDKDGICHCPAGYKPTSQTPFIADDGKVYWKGGKQVCAK